MIPTLCQFQVQAFHGFLFDGVSFTSIDFPGAFFTRAIGVNDTGQIVGDDTEASEGLSHGLLATRISGPGELLDALIVRVQSISSLNKGQANSVISELQAAQRSMARGNHNAARGQLDAFINEVQARGRGGRLNAATASPQQERA
jgi:hypothetical protein